MPPPASVDNILKHYHPAIKNVIVPGLVFFAITAAVVCLLCNFGSQYAEQAILGNERDLQRALLDKPLDSVYAWRDSLVRSRRIEIFGLGILASMALTVIAIILWARMTRRLLSVYGSEVDRLKDTIGSQKLMLDAINHSMQAGLVLADESGRIRACNPAFCRLCGHDRIEQGASVLDVMPGNSGRELLDCIVMSNDIAQIGGNSGYGDDRVDCRTIEIVIPCPALDHGKGSQDDDELYMGGRLYSVSLFSCPSAGGTEFPGGTGCVAVFREITGPRNEAVKKRRRQAALVSALSQAIESVDGNLVGHSDRMARLAVEISDALDLDPDQRETLEFATYLSQIGRLFVPRELFSKQGRLTEQEREQIRKMPEHASRMLRELHFDLPIRETIGEMGERMDGSGSPHGLVGEQISLCGRALAVINAYVAMTSVRAWRPGGSMSAGQAIQMLSADEGFDQRIVDALKIIVSDKADGGGSA